MKVALISARVTDVTTMPLGILYLGAVLRESGHSIKAYDPLPTIHESKVAEKVLKEEPEIVGISSTTAQFARATNIAMHIKKISPGIPIVFGGVHVTALPKDVLQNDFVDFVVFGEGEYTMLELCDILEKNGGVGEIHGLGYKENDCIYLNKPRDLIQNLDELPFPARDLLPVEWYMQPPGKIRGFWLDRSLTLMASRGCPYHCIYCDSHIVFGRTPRYRSPANVVAEIKMLVEEYTVQGAWFHDDELTIDEKWMFEFCELLKKEDLDFRWSCQGRVNQGSKELLEKMRDIGCVQIDYGVESGSPKMLKVLKKGITLQQIREKFRETRDVGIRACATVIIGIPGETLADINQTATLIKEIKPDFAEFYYMTPFPGTELYQMAEKNDWLPKMPFSEKWLFTRVADEPPMSINMPKEELMRIRSRLNNTVMWQNYMSYLKNPEYVIKVVAILLQGMPGLIKGLKRFFKTGKIDSIPYSILEYKRLHKYPKIY